MNLNPTGQCPKNFVAPDFSVDISLPKIFVMLCNVNTPLCKLPFEFSYYDLIVCKKQSVWSCID